MSKAITFLVQIFLGNFYRHLPIFSGHTDLYGNRFIADSATWLPTSSLNEPARFYWKKFGHLFGLRVKWQDQGNYSPACGCDVTFVQLARWWHIDVTSHMYSLPACSSTKFVYFCLSTIPYLIYLTVNLTKPKFRPIVLWCKRQTFRSFLRSPEPRQIFAKISRSGWSGRVVDNPIRLRRSPSCIQISSCTFQCNQCDQMGRIFQSYWNYFSSKFVANTKIAFDSLTFHLSEIKIFWTALV